MKRRVTSSWKWAVFEKRQGFTSISGVWLATGIVPSFDMTGRYLKINWNNALKFVKVILWNSQISNGQRLFCSRYAKRFPWPQAPWPARGAERHLMGAAHRCAEEGLARPIPAAPDLPAKIPAMDKSWGIQAHYWRVGGSFAGTRWHWHPRGIH